MYSLAVDKNELEILNTALGYDSSTKKFCPSKVFGKVTIRVRGASCTICHAREPHTRSGIYYKLIACVIGVCARAKKRDEGGEGRK